MSETTNLKLFKHDNPSTNTNPFDVEQALNDNWNKIDTAVGNLQENIKKNNEDITDIDTRVEETERKIETAQDDITKIKEEQITQNKSIENNTTDIQTLQEENVNLKAQIPTGTVSGEEISLQDSAEMELVDFGLQGNSYQEVEEGKNLVILEDKEILLNGLTISIVAGVINVSGTTNVTYSPYTNVGKVELKEGKTYYIKKIGSNNFGAQLYHEDNTAYKWFDTTESSFIAEKTETCYVQLTFLGNSTTTAETKLLISEDSGLDWVEGKEPKPTLENQSKIQAVGDDGSVEIVKSNKNLLNFGYDSIAGITFNKNRVTIKNPNSYNYCEKFNLKANKILSGKTVTFTYVSNGEVIGDNYVDLIFNTNKRSYIVQCNHNKNHGKYINEVFKKTIPFAIDEYLTACIAWTAGTTCDLTIDVQVEIADTATDFIEHKGNIYNLPVQKPFLKGDYFVKEDNQWKEVHLREKRNIKDDIQNAILSSTTNFIYIPNSLANTAFYKTNADDVGVISNILRHASYNNMNNAIVDYGIGISDAGSLVIRIKEFKTLEEYKNELNNENYYYYYPLRNPSKIECTGEQTQVLEQIIKDGTYKEVTHFYTTEDLKPTIELTYYKDLEILFKNQASIQATLNNVQAQILELGGN